MRTEILKELKESYEPYASFWEEWKEYRFNGLTAMDIYIIEVQAENDFATDIKDLMMFYNQNKNLHNLITKLRENYQQFQDWLIQKFQIAILKSTDEEIPVDLFFRIPLSCFEKLACGYRTLSAGQIKILQKFNCESLQEIFFFNSNKDLRSGKKFDIVTEFQTILKIEKAIYQSLKKEVPKLNRNYTFN